MKDVFVAIVHEAMRLQWLEVTSRNLVSLFRGNCDRFNPVKGVLQNKADIIFQCNNQFMGDEGIGGTCPQVQEKGPILLENAFDLGCPSTRPLQVFVTGPAVIVVAINNPQIVGWGGHHHVNRLLAQFAHPKNAILDKQRII